MEDFAVDFMFDKGMHARSHRFSLKLFTLVGATTRVGLLSAPLRDRFGIFRNLDFYTEDDLVKITKRSAKLLNLKMHFISLSKLRKRLKYGVKEELLPLIEVRGIGRARARRLWRSNVRSIADLKKIDKKDLSKIFGEGIAKKVKEAIGQKV